MIKNTKLYHFGVLTSNVHMAWTMAVCGRLKSDYSYSKGIVYNNFPWCKPTPEQVKQIERTAQAILDARNLYPDCSLADLYDELTMLPELCKAHTVNGLVEFVIIEFSGNLLDGNTVTTVSTGSIILPLKSPYMRPSVI